MDDRTLTYKVEFCEEGSSQYYFMNYIQNNSHILDVGCACGDFGRLLKQHNESVTLYGMEYNLGSIKVGESTKAYEKIYQVDLNSFDKTNFQELYNKFDYIVFGDVLEHILYPEKILHIFKAFLKKGGYFLISFPNTAHASVKAELLTNTLEFTETGLLDKTHIHFWTHKGIANILSKNSLKIDETNRTFFNFQGCQSENNFKKLPSAIQKFIKEDKHSHVWQYIVKASLSDNDIHSHNIHMLNDWNNPKEKIFTRICNAIYKKIRTSRKVRIRLFGISVYSKKI